MDAGKLVFMANQIAGFFKSYPEPEAVAGVKEHIESFWSPGMRKTLQARIHDRSDGIEHLVVAAMTDAPCDAESPIKKEMQGPGALGQLESDAG